MPGLVLEGGSLRGIFSAGVMDALLDNDINFDYIIGVSAGITNGMSYISKQKERNLDILRKYRNDKRYLSKRNLFRCGSIFDFNFLFNEIPNKLSPFDWNTYNNFKGTIKIGITDISTGKIFYEDGKKLDRSCSFLRATCAIPFLVPPITINNKTFCDGGLADPIPIKQSITDGNKKNLVILTQPKGFIKENSSFIRLAAPFYERRYPKLIRALRERPKLYNNTLNYLDILQSENPNNLIIIRPKYKLNSFESNIENLEKAYYHGYEIGVENLQLIKNLFL